MHRSHALVLTQLPPPAPIPSSTTTTTAGSVAVAAAAAAFISQASNSAAKLSSTKSTFFSTSPLSSLSKKPTSNPKPTHVRYPSAPSLPYTALPSPILCHPLLDATEPFPEYIETMADFPDPANTLPPSAVAAAAASAAMRPTFWERVLSPLLFISFILGLYAVDTSNRTRLESSSSYSSSVSSGSDLEVSNWVRQRGDAGREGGGEASVRSRVNTGKDGKKESWFWLGKKRRMAKMEIADALEWRGLIAIALVLGAAIAILAAVWGGEKVFALVKKSGALKAAKEMKWRRV